MRRFSWKRVDEVDTTAFAGSPGCPGLGQGAPLEFIMNVNS